MATPTLLPVIPRPTPVIVRSGNRVQVGSSPGTAALLELPPGASAPRVAQVLQDLRSPRSIPQLARSLRRSGLTVTAFRRLLADLVTAGQALDRPLRRAATRLSVAVIGHDGIGDLISAGLADAGIVHRRLRPEPGSLELPRPRGTNLVLLTDAVIPDPAIVRPLTLAGVPHLPVHVRDGAGVIGPLVLPGLTGCLHCQDLHRGECDPDWACLAAGLQGAAGWAPPHTVRATVALALAQLSDLADRLATADAPAPDLAGHVLELRSTPARIIRRAAPPHARCFCCQQVPLSSEDGKGTS